MLDATFACPDLTTFARLDELGLEAIGQRLEPDRAVLACRVVEPDEWCRRCGCRGRARDTVVRRLAHEPFGWRPTVLLVRVRRYHCTGCGHVWRQDTSKAAEPRAKLSRGGLRWALEALVVGHLSVARIAAALAICWNTANDAVLAEGQRALIDDLHRFDGVQVLGVDEHVWRHTRRGDKYVTVIIDLTAVRAGTGPARLLDMVAGRSKQAFQQWLADRPATWRQGLEVVAMDGFTGFKTATTEALPDAVAVMDPASPTPEQPTVHAGVDLDLPAFAQLWPAVLESVAGESRLLAASLAEAKPSALEDRELRLAWGQSAAFSKQMAENAANKELIAQAIRAVTGSSLRLALELRSDADHAAHHGSGAAPPPAELSEDELIARLVDAFDATELPPDPPSRTEP